MAREFDPRRFSISMSRTTEGFEIENAYRDIIPKGLDGQTIWNLWDICAKFGEIGGLGMQYRKHKLWIQINIISPYGPIGNGLSVMPENPSQTKLSTGPDIFILENGLAFLCDSTTTPEQIKTSIQTIDDEAAKLNKIAGGIRLQTL